MQSTYSLLWRDTECCQKLFCKLGEGQRELGVWNNSAVMKGSDCQGAQCLGCSWQSKAEAWWPAHGAHWAPASLSGLWQAWSGSGFGSSCSRPADAVFLSPLDASVSHVDILGCLFPFSQYLSSLIPSQSHWGGGILAVPFYLTYSKHPM